MLCKGSCLGAFHQVQGLVCQQGLIRAVTDTRIARDVQDHCTGLKHCHPTYFIKTNLYTRCENQGARLNARHPRVNLPCPPFRPLQVSPCTQHALRAL